MAIKIICPSHSRHRSVLTNIKNMILFVDKSELIEYEQNNDFKIHTHDGLNNLSKIRQYIYDKYPDVFMVDDDVVCVQRLYQTHDQDLTPDAIHDLIQDTYRRSKNIDSFLFGFNNDPNPTHYNQHKPFVLNSYINGCAFGLRENKNLYFSPKTVACESHWINLLNAYYNRFCFIDKRFHFRQKKDSTFLRPGGQTSRRTMKTEEADTLFLKKKFGDSVKIKNKKTKLSNFMNFKESLILDYEIYLRFARSNRQ